MRLLAKISCVIVGVLFILSGLVKAVDPLGFSYKLEEYNAVAGLSALDFTSLFLAISLCALEILIGFSLLLRWKVSFWSSILLILIVFFTFLTGASAIFGVVKDCGCFGDALKLTPTESFIKDLILLVLSLIIYAQRLYLFPLFKEALANRLVLTLGALASLSISYIGINHLPIIDYRAYKIGNSLIEKMQDGIPEEVESKFIYKEKSSSKEQTFSTEDILNLDYDKWEFVDVKHTIIKEGKSASISDFMILDPFGADRTIEILQEDKYQIWVISYSMNNANKDAFKGIASLANELQGISFLGLTNGSPEENENFRHDIQAAFPFFSADQTALKTMIRSNPGIMLIKNGKVLEKWHYNDGIDASLIKSKLE